jgi:HlyD family secretion protein
MLLGGLVFCMAFGAWATFGQIDEVGHAQGRLVPKGEVYKIHPIDSGKIASIQVKEGQAVKAGQTLIELDTEMAEAEVERVEQLLSSEKTQLSQMQALIERTRDEGHIRGEIAIAEAQAQMAAIAQAKAKAEAQKMAIAQANANTATNQKLLLNCIQMRWLIRLEWTG